MSDPVPVPCVRTIDTATSALRCRAHPGQVFPWSPNRDCALPVASACAVCARAQVPIETRFSWSLLCPTCARLDAALARPHGAASMTPTRGQLGCEAGTVYAALFPERASQTTVSVDAGPVLSVRSATYPGADPWIARVGAHRQATVVAMAAAAGMEGVARWAVWEARFVPSPAATAAAYQEYVAQVHPWVDTVEPRTADLTWLTDLAANS